MPYRIDLTIPLLVSDWSDGEVQQLLFEMITNAANCAHLADAMDCIVAKKDASDVEKKMLDQAIEQHNGWSNVFSQAHSELSRGEKNQILHLSLGITHDLAWTEEFFMDELPKALIGHAQLHHQKTAETYSKQLQEETKNLSMMASLKAVVSVHQEWDRILDQTNFVVQVAPRQPRNSKHGY